MLLRGRMILGVAEIFPAKFTVPIQKERKKCQIIEMNTNILRFTGQKNRFLLGFDLQTRRKNIESLASFDVRRLYGFHCKSFHQKVFYFVTQAPRVFCHHIPKSFNLSSIALPIVRITVDITTQKWQNADGLTKLNVWSNWSPSFHLRYIYYYL